MLYTILDFVESGFEQIPPNKSCAEKPQELHKPRTQTPKNASVRFSDILIIYHDYDVEKNNKKDQRIQRKRHKLAYTACPSYALKVTSDQIYSFYCDLKANPDKSKPMLVDVRDGNDYQPVIVEDLENKFTKCLVAMDHDYLTGKRKTCLEIQASTPTEVEHRSPCKTRKLDLIDGNECERFDSSFTNDSHPLISHSVLITPEDNPQGNQEKQFEGDCQEQPTAKIIIIIIITLFKSLILLAEYECSTNWGDCKSNKSNQMLLFEERGKPEYPEKNLSEQSREPTNSAHI